MERLGHTERTRVRRAPHRAVAERAALHALLDEALICHVGLVDDGQPVIIPMAFGRDGERLLLHGSTASRTMRMAASGAPLCVTVTLVDGLVLARSAFHHSVNYRSAVILGRVTPVTAEADKAAALQVLTEHLVPGRWADVRAPSRKELAATAVVALPLDEASVKMRSGPPVDDEDDYDRPGWAGIVPLTRVFGPPLADPRLSPQAEAPAHVRQYSRPMGTAAPADP